MNFKKNLRINLSYLKDTLFCSRIFHMIWNGFFPVVGGYLVLGVLPCIVLQLVGLSQRSVAPVWSSILLSSMGWGILFFIAANILLAMLMFIELPAETVVHWISRKNQ